MKKTAALYSIALDETVKIQDIQQLMNINTYLVPCIFYQTQLESLGEIAFKILSTRNSNYFSLIFYGLAFFWHLLLQWLTPTFKVITLVAIIIFCQWWNIDSAWNKKMEPHKSLERRPGGITRSGLRNFLNWCPPSRVHLHTSRHKSRAHHYMLMSGIGRLLRHLTSFFLEIRTCGTGSSLTRFHDMGFF